MGSPRGRGPVAVGPGPARELRDRRARAAPAVQANRAVQRHSAVPAENGRPVLLVHQTDLRQLGPVVGLDRPSGGQRLGKDVSRFVFFLLLFSPRNVRARVKIRKTIGTSGTILVLMHFGKKKKNQGKNWEKKI